MRGGLTGRRGGRRKEEGRGGLRCKERMAGDRPGRGGRMRSGAKARSREPVEGEEVRAGGTNKGTQRREKKSGEEM